MFATVLSEIIATKIGLRARNLKEAIDRMLNDEEDDTSSLSRLWDSLKLMKNPKNPRIEKFYSNPEIKYLGSTGIFKTPSQFKTVTFSRTLLYELNGSGPLDKDRIKKEIEHSIDPEGNPRIGKKGVTDDRIPTLDKQSAQFVLSLFNDSYGDLVKFKLQLEAWFDRTMEQCTEWYKRKIQIVLLVLGFMLAWFFNADTFTIISKLSNDKDAREKMVTLAAAYTQTHTSPDKIDLSDSTGKKIDSLNSVARQLQQDVQNANTILGLGGWPPDSVLVTIDSKTHKFVYVPQADEQVVMDMKIDSLKEGNYLHFIGAYKWGYFVRLPVYHFFGFLITAIAISLGAPFWFDLLNKLMQLRTSLKQSTDSTNTTDSGTVSPLNRVG